MPASRWFAGPGFDLGFFHVPIWATWLLCFLLPASLRDQPLAPWVWLVAVVVVDVGHVWSSVYRTYLDPVTRATQGRLLRLVPALCFVGCFAVALAGNATFWRVLSYIAAYHFVKQQIGITALYRARYAQVTGATDRAAAARLRFWDNAAVYAATLGPLLWWHAHLPRKFSWFIDGDFLNPAALLSGLPTWLTTLGAGLFYLAWWGTLLTWLVLHLRPVLRRRAPLPLGKLLWVGGTGVNWYLGLVYFNSDLVFTLTNVIAHGIPYYGLIALHQYRKRAAAAAEPAEAEPAAAQPAPAGRPRMRLLALTCALLALMPVLGFCEELLWDFLLYREHVPLFSSIWPYWREAVTHPVWQAFWIAVLSMPQTVHYVLDGFIWKMDRRNPDLRPLLFPRPQN